MANAPTTPNAYMAQLEEERRLPLETLRATILKNLPAGFTETMSYGMVGYVVSHSLYPEGYHCDPKLPLPFLSFANQKNFVALYHMGLYADENLMDWFVSEYPKHTSAKLDMGKSCMRFKKPELIPFDLIGQLCQKMTPQNWIDLYEAKFKR